MILDALHHQITHELVQIVETRCSARSDGVLDPPLCGYIFISYSMSTLFVFGNHVCTVYIFLCTVCVSVWLILCVRLSICVSVYLLLCSVFVWCFCLCLCVYVSVCFVFCCNVVSLCYLYNRVQSAGGVSPLNASQTAPVPSPVLLIIIIIVVPGEFSILTIKMMTILTTTDFQLSVSLLFLSMCCCLESLSWVSAGESQTQLNRETSTVSLN